MCSMWAERLYALRAATLEPGRWLGSWRLSVVLMVTAGFYHVLLAVWAMLSPPQVVGNIASLLPFWLAYGLLLANTAVCLWRRFPVLRREMAGGEGRWSALGGYLFHGAFGLLALGFLLTLATRQEARVWVAAGEEFLGREDQLLFRPSPDPVAPTAGVAGVAAGLPAFRVREVVPRFWRDELLFTHLRASLELPGGRRAVTRINRPLPLGPGTFLRLSGMGYAPRYELVDRRGTVVDSAFVKMNLFPPGRRDYFRLEGLPHRFHLRIWPDLTLGADGAPATRSMELADPGVAVEVTRGRLALGSAVLRQGESLGFEGLAIRFPEIRYWGEFAIVRDPGAPVLFAGYLVGLAGLALWLLGGWSGRVGPSTAAEAGTQP